MCEQYASNRRATPRDILGLPSNFSAPVARWPCLEVRRGAEPGRRGNAQPPGRSGSAADVDGLGDTHEFVVKGDLQPGMCAEGSGCQSASQTRPCELIPNEFTRVMLDGDSLSFPTVLIQPTYTGSTAPPPAMVWQISSSSAVDEDGRRALAEQ